MNILHYMITTKTPLDNMAVILEAARGSSAVNQQAADCETPLYLACRTPVPDQCERVRLLLEARATDSIDAGAVWKGYGGHTALFAACCFGVGSNETFKLLIKA